MKHNLKALCNKFNLDEITITLLALMVSDSLLVPVSNPRTNIPDIINLYNFVKDYYDFITSNRI